MATFLLLSSLTLCVVLSVLGQPTCDWNSSGGQRTELNPASWDAGAQLLVKRSDISDEAACKAACCERDDCHLALIGTPADGTSECFLVNCMKDGKDVCVLRDSVQFSAYRRTPALSDEPEQPKVQLLSERAASSNNNATNTDYCRYTSVVGNCRAAFPRFYYDVTNQTCKQFIYGGCGGNNNNFETLEDCEKACSGVTGDVLPDPQASPKRRMVVPEKGVELDVPLPEMSAEEFAEKCQAPPKVGMCRASMPRFYYSSGICQPFKYGGCGGNANNYLSEEDCMKTCTVKVVESSDKHYQESCTVPSDSGMCRALFYKYFFEPSTQSCKVFTYGGCGGNKNRYDTEDECMSKCALREGNFDGHGHRPPRWTPGFFLVATLAIISVVLLVGLFMITTRRAKQQQQLLLDDKQELLPEEHLPIEDPPKFS